MTDTIQLANGVVIDTNTGRPVPGTVTQAVEIDRKAKVVAPTGPKQMAKERTNRHIRTRLNDLAGEPRKIAATSVVLGLFLLGLPDQDIAECTGFTIDQVEMLRSTDLFDELHAKMLTNVRAAAQDQVRVALEEASLTAAAEIVNAMQSENEEIRIKAAKDVLDRSGHRPADVVEHRHSFGDEMRVRIIKDTPADKVPVLDLQANH